MHSHRICAFRVQHMLCILLCSITESATCIGCSWQLLHATSLQTSRRVLIKGHQVIAHQARRGRVAIWPNRKKTRSREGVCMELWRAPGPMQLPLSAGMCER